MCAASCALCVRGRTVVKFHGSAEGAQWMKRKFWEMQSVSQNGNWQQLATGSGRQWIWIPYMRCAHKECVIFTNSRRQEIIKSNVLDIINESNYRCERRSARARVCVFVNTFPCHHKSQRMKWQHRDRRWQRRRILDGVKSKTMSKKGAMTRLFSLRLCGRIVYCTSWMVRRPCSSGACALCKKSQLLPLAFVPRTYFAYTYIKANACAARNGNVIKRKRNARSSHHSAEPTKEKGK